MLKHIRPFLVAPDDIGPLEPNTVDRCHYKFVLPQSQIEYSNFLGFFNYRPNYPCSSVRTVPGGGLVPSGCRPSLRETATDEGTGWFGRQVPDPDRPRTEIDTIDEIEQCLMNFDPDDALTSVKRIECEVPQNNWGILGPPKRLWHANSSAIVSVSSGGTGIIASEDPQIVSIPAGEHTMDWEAGTQFSLIWDEIVPYALALGGVLSELFLNRYLDDLAKKAAIDVDPIVDAAGSAEKWRIIRQKARNSAVKWAITNPIGKLDTILSAGQTLADTLELGEDPSLYTSASSIAQQLVKVYDVHPPTIVATKNQFTVEALSFGGTATRVYFDEFLKAITVSDSCGREPLLTNDAEDFLPLGETTITWTARDGGPNPPDRLHEFFPTVQQLITVEDTQAPLMLAPPSQVVEKTCTLGPGLCGIGRNAISLGSPLVADLADPEPLIGNNAPLVFLANSRTEVQWTATDVSGNQAEELQWVTVKETGSNTAPQAHDQVADTLTSKPVDIVLSAQDNDLLDGMFDPVWFAIDHNPERGSFVAPLLPFFFDDYRTKPSEDLPGFAQAVAVGQAQSWLTTNVCEKNGQPPIDFVYKPLFAHVQDDGTRFVLDHYFICVGENVSAREADQRLRISKWDKDDEFVAHKTFGPNAEDGPNNDAFVIGADGHLYFSTFTHGGSSSEFFLRQCSTAFEQDGGTFVPS